MDIKQQTAMRLALVLLVLAVYWGALSSGFVWDDEPVLVDNPLFSSARNLSKVFIAEDELPGIKTGFYRPVTYLSFFIDRIVYGFMPSGYHLTNILLHIAVAILLMKLLYEIVPNWIAALLAALLFAVHPVNTEAVNFISARNNMLSAMFILSSMLLHIRGRYVYAGALYGISLLSKESGIFLPLLMFAYDRFYLKNAISYRKYAPYTIALLLYLLARKVVVENTSVNFELGYLDKRVIILPELFIRYVMLVVFPWRIKTPHYVGFYQSFPAMLVLYYAALALIAYAFWRYRENRTVLFAFIWLVVFFLPVSGIVPLGYIIMADRYAYMPAMGIFLLIAYMIDRLKQYKWPLLALMSIALIYCSLYTSGRTAIWKGNRVLFQSMIKDSPDSSIGYQNLGGLYYQEGRLDDAERMLYEATHKFPVIQESHALLGQIYWERGYVMGAISTIQKAIDIMPGSQNWKNYLILSMIFHQQGDEDTSGMYLIKASDALGYTPEQTIDITLVWSEKITDRAKKLLLDNENERASALLNRALMYWPVNYDANLYLGIIEAKERQYDNALSFFARASSIRPQSPEPHYYRFLAFKEKGMIEESDAEINVYKSLGGGILPR